MKNILLFLIFFITNNIIAQDIIIKTNGDEISAKVTEVDVDKVKYKKFDNQDGPTYNILKSEIFMIRYQNGTKDLFTTESTKPQTVNNSNYNIDGTWYCDVKSANYIIKKRDNNFYLIDNGTELGLIYESDNKFSVGGSSQLYLVFENENQGYFINDKNEKIPLVRKGTLNTDKNNNTNQVNNPTVVNNNKEVPYGTIYSSYGVAGDGFGFGLNLILGRSYLMSIGFETAGGNTLFEIGFGTDFFGLFNKRLIFLGEYGFGSGIISYDVQLIYKTNKVAFGIGFTNIDDETYEYFKLGVGYSF